MRAPTMGSDHVDDHALVSAHATEQMQQHDRTVDQTEISQGSAKIISLAGARAAMGAGDMEVVPIDPKNEDGQRGTSSHLADSA